MDNFFLYLNYEFMNFVNFLLYARRKKILNVISNKSKNPFAVFRCSKEYLNIEIYSETFEKKMKPKYT